MFTATELVSLPQGRGIDLSASQVHRLVSGAPERLSVRMLSALCDILECTRADLVATRPRTPASAGPPPATVSQPGPAAGTRSRDPQPGPAAGTRSRDHHAAGTVSQPGP